MLQSGSAQNPRNPRMFSNLSFLFKYPRLFSNLTQCSRMFSKRNVLKMPLFWPYIGVRNLPIRQHPVKKGANRTAAEQMLGSRRPRVTLTSRAEVAPKRKRPMAASDINYPSAVFSSTETRLPMTCAFVSHFRPCCVRWICVEFSTQLCLAGIGTVCSEVSG